VSVFPLVSTGGAAAIAAGRAGSPWHEVQLPLASTTPFTCVARFTDVAV
jgi:hypothetical protein